MTTGWRATVIVNYDQANLTSLSIGREKKHICTYLGKNKKKYRVFAFPERKELLRRISRPYQVLQMSRTWWVGGFAIFNKVEWSKRFTPGEGKMSNMPKAKAESPHIKWISQRKRLNHFPYATFQLAPFCRDECHTRCYKITHRGHNMFQYNRPVKFDIFPHLFFFFFTLCTEQTRALSHMTKVELAVCPTVWAVVFFSWKIECCNGSADRDRLMAVEEAIWQLKDKS